jgi:hypothetical protein
MNVLDTHTITISVRRIDLAALRKLSTVSHTLAKQLDPMTGIEQTALVSVLDNLINQIAVKTNF